LRNTPSISISGLLQHEIAGPDDTVPVTITTHPNRQDKITSALAGLEKLPTVCIRIVNIPEDKELPSRKENNSL
jgi:hypothetical protein